ncbi:MAG: dethiobiotin synthase [Azoarcus sp.]|jgi:dethiobiotin synthetase|nr:dethiobiotin synthase [Azoarcus sp.]
MSAFHAWFVTGTDTEIGKTTTTCVLMHAARARGFSTLGMKPVAAGAQIIDGKLINEDAVRLLAASSFDPGPALLNPYCLRTPIAPHIAAEEENVRLEAAPIRQAFTALRARCDALFVEGAGGFLSPLGEGFDAASLALDLALPIILVVGMKPGCINHARLSAEAITARGLCFDGWVANCVQPDMPYLEKNIETLRRRIDVPLLGVLPYAPGAAPDTQAHLVTLPMHSLCQEVQP